MMVSRLRAGARATHAKTHRGTGRHHPVFETGWWFNPIQVSAQVEACMPSV